MAGKEGRYYEDSDWRHDVDYETPFTIYFYWATPIEGDESQYEIRSYYWANDEMITTGTVLDKLLKKLATNARDHGTNPRPFAHGFNAPWCRKSYIVLGLPYKDGFEPNDAIDIVHDDDGDMKPNHTFFDGEERSLKDTGGRDFSVTWAVNYMKTRDGEDLPANEVQHFRLSFMGKGKSVRTDPPDNGTNMGPPIGSPP